MLVLVTSIVVFTVVGGVAFFEVVDNVDVFIDIGIAVVGVISGLCVVVITTLVVIFFGAFCIVSVVTSSFGELTASESVNCANKKSIVKINRSIFNQKKKINALFLTFNANRHVIQAACI